MNSSDLPTPEIVAAIPPLPHFYDEEDSRVVSILEQVSSFCGKEFTIVPPDPDKEPGVPIPHSDDVEDHTETVEPEPGDPDFVINPDDPDKTGQIDPDKPGEQPGNVVDPEDPSVPPAPLQPDELDKLREAYKEALAKNLEEKKDYWAALWQVIRLLSVYGCWNEHSMDTFIIQQRFQSLTLAQLPYCSQFSCNCQDNKLIKIDIDYAPLDSRPVDEDHPTEIISPFIEGWIEWADRTGEIHKEPISAEYLNSHYNSSTQQILLAPKDFQAFYRGRCECPDDITITLHYNAGYLTIPPALLPIVCQLLGRIEDTKMSVSDCASTLTQVCGLLKSKKVGNVQYTWSEADNDSSKTRALVTDVYNIANLGELSAISRCDIINKEIAGFVI